MKLTLLFLSIVLPVGIYGCQPAEKTGQPPSTQTAAQGITTDSIVRDTLTNRQGGKLIMAYDNARHTATFVLAGEVIKLQQDTLASGISYRNAQYDYTERQGTVTLRKEGKIVFRNP